MISKRARGAAAQGQRDAGARETREAAAPDGCDATAGGTRAVKARGTPLRSSAALKTGTGPMPAAPARTHDSAPAPRLRIELELDPAAAARLPRHPGLARASGTRSRGAATALVWYDTAEGALAAVGLALEAPRRGPRRLLRVLPEADRPWRPAAPPETVELLKDGAMPDLAKGSPLVPIAAFDGRATRLPLGGADGAALEAELLSGTLRAVAATRPVARLSLAGPDRPVLALARALAADLPALPPRAALAEEGRALARGETVRARRRGAPDLAAAASAEDALALALGHLVEVIIHQAPLARLETGPEGVHQMRVALRRLRSMLRLFRPVADGPSLRGLEAGLKALAATLGPARDWDVFCAGIARDLAAALPGEPRLAGLLRAAEARRQAAYAALRVALDGAGFRTLVWDAVALQAMRGWRAEAAEETAVARDAGLVEFAETALARRWRRVLARGEAMQAAAEDDAEALHTLRIEGKRLRYAAEIFAPLWPGKASRRFLKRLAALQEALGLANDAAVARGLAASLAGRDRGSTGGRAWSIGVAEGWALARAGRARGKAMQAWEALLRVEPFWETG